jgi:hypothetical protein
MLETLAEYLFHMIIVKGIADGPSAPPVFYQARLLQYAQLVGYGGLVHAQERCDIVYIQFRTGQEIEDLDPRNVPEDPEEFGKVDERCFTRHRFFELPFIMPAHAKIIDLPGGMDVFRSVHRVHAYQYILYMNIYSYIHDLSSRKCTPAIFFKKYYFYSIFFYRPLRPRLAELTVEALIGAR